MQISPRTALLVIDVQNDFIPGGQLAVPEGDQIVPLINRLGGLFKQVVIAQDWHPSGHASFASSHPGYQPYEVIQLPYGEQVLWPEHCVQGTAGAEFHPELNLPHAQLIIRKGCNPDIDSYSAFLEADRRTTTGLAGYLKERGIDTVYMVGLALDFCVMFSALDARAAGFNAFVVLDACRAIDRDGSLAAAMERMQTAGVGLIQSNQLI
ncbi:MULTISPECIES: bifunctional nicotinamidase/pyrazinamidase [Pseudomonas]|jgi:nicotinamidase/pyrazinamidase|uniref:bifunctional nicotinamidase/pyrazinamidase n=1 Tax=Pseudomonas TaxID=286 RepID=UPI000BC920C8|nr:MULTISPECIES: bifunctional nicotinamidase/pyrazinamidase [unclassified Pseudomonas]MBB6157304.1 nicotinamidase/pyrazinamidase [Pseudomonas sp. JAI115]POA23284.1 bifunctional nicotinamidase/pyrazinamidase [Pseudomonas sp. FW305-3-2-15-E-TSA4]POA31713.1 bifunctional nicotinamidase/pyrazinamidase [Pseudomonas sp. FW305-3-2-15-E-TSA2]SNY38353.1 nicotinamidase/pyrazinamidase [Pseudomonas sp. LAMO17WK12:I6]SNY38578.1 nicotinamidase/pyrazinamidase [Pseudomonas sp. LAMO17WK12:I5]